MDPKVTGFPMQIRLTFLTILSSFFFLGGPCRAATEAEKEVARSEAFGAAMDALSMDDLEKAESIFRRLWEEEQTYDVALSLAQIELELGRYREAAAHIRFGLRHIAPREKSEVIQGARDGLEEARRFVGMVRISVQPPDAEVLVDGVALPPWAEGEAFVEPGEHRVLARRADGAVVERTFRVGAGEEKQLVLTLDTSELRQAAELSESTPAAPPRLTVDDHGSGQRSMVPVYVGAGLTAAGVGAWIGFGFAVRSARSEVDGYASRIGGSGCLDGGAAAGLCADARGALDRERRSALMGNIGLGVGVTAAVATVGYVLFWPKSRTSAENVGSVSLRPSIAVDATGGSLGLSGTF